MDASTREQLQTVYAAAGVLAELDGQDPTLVIEMTQTMLADLLDTGQLADLTGYVRKYCDVIDQAADADRIAAEIRESAHPGPGQ